MKLVYITAKDSSEHSGVYKKVRSQLYGFALAGIKTELIECEEIPRWKKAFPFSSRSFEWNKIRVPSDADVIYIRYQLSDYPFINFLKKCKKKLPNSKIILEVPMYPYEDELKEISNIITNFRDKFYSKQIKKYVNQVTTCTPFDKIFGVPAILIVNGIDVNKVKPKNVKSSNHSEINIIAVALVNFSHGYDRLIAGLNNYYSNKNEPKREVVFHLVGDGEVISQLKEYVCSHNLSDRVIFYGFKSGQELDEIYEKADIGLDVLGGHRKGDKWFGTLKSREYLSKGLPFITEYPLTKELDPVKKYIMKVSANESPIDIDEVIKFYDNAITADTIEDMRSFAFAYCDSSIVMKPVVDYINKNDKD